MAEEDSTEKISEEIVNEDEEINKIAEHTRENFEKVGFAQRRLPQFYDKMKMSQAKWRGRKDRLKSGAGSVAAAFKPANIADSVSQGFQGAKGMGTRGLDKVLSAKYGQIAKGGAGLALAGAAGVAVGGAKATKAIVKSPFAMGAGMSNFMDKTAEKRFWAPVMFIFLGLFDFFLIQSIFGVNSFIPAVVDGILVIMGFYAFNRNYMVAAPMALELFYAPIAIRFGWETTTWPFWLIFGGIVFFKEIFSGEINLSAGQATMATFVGAAVILFLFPQVLQAGQTVMTSQLNNPWLDELGDVTTDRIEFGSNHWGGFIGDLTDCVIPDWMGGKSNCTNLQTRVDPSQEAALKGKERKDLEPVKWDMDFRENLYSKYLIDEDITLWAEFEFQSGEYPVAGVYSWKLGDKVGVAKPVNWSTTTFDGNVWKYTKRPLSGSWTSSQFTEEGTYTAEVRARFVIKTQVEYKTWFVKYFEPFDVGELRKEHAVLRNNIIPKSEAAPGPVLVSMDLGNDESPIPILNPQSHADPGFLPTLTIKLDDKSGGTKKKKIRAVNSIVVKGEKWFDLKGCQNIFTEQDGGYWAVTSKELENINARISEKAPFVYVRCEMNIIDVDNTIFTSDSGAPAEVEVVALVSYEYEVMQSASIEIKDRFAGGYSYEDIECIETGLFTRANNPLDQTQYVEGLIRTEAKKRKVPLLVALSLADQESWRTQFWDPDGPHYSSDKTPWSTIINQNMKNGEVKSTDMGVMMINTIHELDKNRLMCDIPYNVEQGMKILKDAFNAPACSDKWDRALNAYNGGQGNCIWHLDKTPHATNVLIRCKQMAGTAGHPWTEQQCDECILEEECPVEFSPPWKGPKYCRATWADPTVTGEICT